MEKIISQEKTKTTNENLNLINRKSLILEGVVEVNNTSESCISLKLKDTTLNISGSNLHITKLDVNTGIVEAEGIFDSIKYGKSGNIFKRIFKWKYLMSCN